MPTSPGGVHGAILTTAVPMAVLGVVAYSVFGAIVALVAVCLVVTLHHVRASRRDAAFALDATEKSLRRAFETLPFPVVHIAPGTPLAGAAYGWVNQAAIKRWGYSFETLTSRPYQELLVGDADLTLDAARRADAGQSVYGHTNIYRAGPLSARPGAELFNAWYNLGGGYWCAKPEDALAKAIAIGEDERARRLRAQDSAEVSARTLAAIGRVGETPPLHA